MGEKSLVAAVTAVVVALAAIGLYTSGEENSAPTCSLAADPSHGKAPLMVIFALAANDSDGSILFWEIDADGDGVSDDNGSEHPHSSYVHFYAVQGTYNVTFSVKDNDGSTAYDNLTVVVLPPNVLPVCDLEASASEGYVPLSITFTMSASDPDGTIKEWRLEIVLTETNVEYYSGHGLPPVYLSHTFVEEGDYWISLSVWDDDGAMYADGVDVFAELESSDG